MVLCLPPLTSDPVNRLAPNAFQRASEFRALFSSIARPLRPHGFIVAFSSSVRMASTGWIDGRRAPTAPRAAGPSGLGAPVAYPQKNLTPPVEIHSFTPSPGRPPAHAAAAGNCTRAPATLLSFPPTPPLAPQNLCSLPRTPLRALRPPAGAGAASAAPSATIQASLALGIRC